MITPDKGLPVEVCKYLNSHPAFNKTHGEIINSHFFDVCIAPIMQDTRDVPIVMKYRKALYYEAKLTMDEAKEFIKWVDQKWTEFHGLKRSEFFKDEGLYEVTDEFEDI